MGAVWAARDPELGRAVAVKLLRVGPGSGNDQQQNRRRLIGEAKAMAHLAHPNVVPVFEVGEMGNQLFLVLELVEGETMGSWLEKHRTLPEILDAFLAAGRGLAAAHKAGIVHRDFKPDNVLVGNDGRPRVTDFGLARRPATDPEAIPLGGPTLAQLLATPTSLTPLGVLLGTPAYMAPEQLRGGLADARSDLFGFCTALYEAVAGTRPYPAPNFIELQRRAEAERIAPPVEGKRVPAWLRRELARGLKADPAKRHASMDELLLALEKGRKNRRTKWLAAAAAAAALAALVSLPARKAGPRTSVAVLGPRDLDPRPASEWLSGALAELLATELESDAHLRLVPPERVAPALSDLALARGAVLDGESILKIRRRLGSDLVLGGTYRLENGKLRVELSLWGAKPQPLLTESESGPPESLAALAGKLGARMRGALGGDGEASVDRAQRSFPADPETARLYVQGVSQLHAWDPATAIDSLKKAEALTRDNPRVETALAEAYLDLNEDVPARAAVALAFEHKGELPPDDRARLEILRERALRNRDQALALGRAFWAKAPDDLERGLQLARLQITVAKDHSSALATLAELRKLPAPANADPRIDILDAVACAVKGDYQRQLVVARRGYALASALGARREMAQGLYYESNAMRKLGSDPTTVRERFQQAEALYREAHDLGGAAGANMMQAAMLADGGDLAGARLQFEAALATYRERGDRLDEGKVLHNLAIVLRRLRDLPGAVDRSRQAQTIFIEMGERASAANALVLLGHLRQDLGDLSGAAAALSESAKIRREIKDPLLVVSLLGLSAVRLSQGDLREAHAVYAEAAALGIGQDKTHAAEVLEGDAQIAFAEDRATEAETAAREAARIAGDTQQVDEAALCEALLARALLKQGKTAEARAAVSRGRALLSKSKAAISRGELAVAEGRIQIAENPRDPAGVQTLRAALEEATSAGVASDQWNARLALAELEPADSRATARARLLSLAREARAQGYGLYAKYAEAAATRR